MFVSELKPRRVGVLGGNWHRPATMAWSKRVFDVVGLCLLAPVAVVLGVIVASALLLAQGRPLFFVASRAGQNGKTFALIKFRTMPLGSDHSSDGVAGGHKIEQISSLCQWIRARRLDEIPQLVNVLRGEMSLVGPRPPDPRYVAERPDLYGPVLQMRPGLTGLATLIMHQYEERYLEQCTSQADADAVYRRRSIPRKARLDLMYQKAWRDAGGVWFDAVLIAKSIRAVLVRG